MQWRQLFLSSGENRLEQVIQETGRRVNGGQLIRICDVEAETGISGMFEALHDLPTGEALANHLRTASTMCYGTAIREFLTKLVAIDRDDIKEQWAGFRQSFIRRHLGLNGDDPSEVLRVAERFAVVALGGELAGQFGITGWVEGEAICSAVEMFGVWLRGRSGPASADAENAVRQVRHFLEAHGQSRFQSVHGDAGETERVINRAGFKRVSDEDDGTVFYVLPEVFRTEVCKGYHSTFVAKELKARGFLGTDPGSNQKNVRLPELGQHKVYAISSRIFEGEEHVKTMAATNVAG